MIADAVYGGRMGNAPPPSDDGWNFRGRGLSQVTGREGYAKLAEKTGLELTEDPGLLSDPDHALECGVADFILCGCCRTRSPTTSLRLPRRSIPPQQEKWPSSKRSDLIPEWPSISGPE
jgi:hypothetical protein